MEPSSDTQSYLQTAYRYVPLRADLIYIGGSPPAPIASPVPGSTPAYRHIRDLDALLSSDVDVSPNSYLLLETPFDRLPARLLNFAREHQVHVVFGCKVDNAVDAAEVHSLVEQARDTGLAVRHYSILPDLDIVVLCVRRDPGAIATPSNVVVLSASQIPNFGDRLGVQALNHVLPAHATVMHHSIFPPGIAPLEQVYNQIDLLIVGLGNSIFQPILKPQLISLVRKSERAIGIFGTQYRELIDPKAMAELIGSLDAWYARYLEDCLLFGDSGPTIHLGDWTISQFPMSRPDTDELLSVERESLFRDEAPDRLIRKIQSHRRVVSARLHPLLCALTSADEVAYHEQREFGSRVASGKFRSMLMDVFGFHYPEGVSFAVDHAAVRRYKEFVAMRMGQLRETLCTALYRSS